MPIPLTAPEVLEREFLLIRAKILEIAASLDRIDRAEGAVSDDPRLDQIAHGLVALAGAESNRAEQVQLIFSLEHDENWQQTFAQDGWEKAPRPAVRPR